MLRFFEANCKENITFIYNLTNLCGKIKIQMKNKKIDNPLGLFILEQMRKHRGMTLRTLEMKSGVSRSEISNIIRGIRKRPNIEVLKAIAKVLKVDPRYLVFLSSGLTFEDVEEIKRKYAPSYSPHLSYEKINHSMGYKVVNEQNMAYAHKIKTLSPETRKVIENLIKAEEYAKMFNHKEKPPKNRDGSS